MGLGLARADVVPEDLELVYPFVECLHLPLRLIHFQEDTTQFLCDLPISLASLLLKILALVAVYDHLSPCF